MITINDRIFRYLTDDNLPSDGSNQDMAVNGAGTPVKFLIRPGPRYKFHLKELIISIVDAKDWEPEQYGKVGALANGTKLEVLAGDDTLIKDLTGGLDIKDNMTWRMLGMLSDGSHNIISTPETTDELLQIRIPLCSPGDCALVLFGRPDQEGNKLQITVSDDLTGLGKHTAFVLGWREQIRKGSGETLLLRDEAMPKEPWKDSR
jgi:hypothetical protein